MVLNEVQLGSFCFLLSSSLGLSDTGQAQVGWGAQKDCRAVWNHLHDLCLPYDGEQQETEHETGCFIICFHASMGSIMGHMSPG